MKSIHLQMKNRSTLKSKRTTSLYGVIVASILLTIGHCLFVSAAEIHDAARDGDVAKITALIAADPTSVNAKADAGGATPLMYAIHFGKSEAAKLLLEKGADFNAKAPNGHTALFEASAGGQVDVVKVLLKKGATVNFDVQPDSRGDDPGCTPLLLAAENGQLEIVKLLLEKGADVNAKSSYNTIHNCATPLIGATKVQADYDSLYGPGGHCDREGTAVVTDRKHGYLEVVRALLDKGAKMDETDNFGHTALFYAANHGQLEVVKLLLEKGAGADVDGKNHNGTPLLFAAQNGDVEIVKLLLGKGANPNAECNSKDKQGKPWTPLAIAQASGFTNVVELLQKATKQP
jgi:ankyrin repeat protein